ncbi:MAG: hypothetical protein CMN78_02100 [Spirochaetales bacterium]|nr:hypothetical protein [Spirochaetales bacterium]
MDDIKVARYPSINRIDPAEWDSIVSEDEIVNSHSHLRAIERSGVNSISYRYYLFTRNNDLIAHATVGIFSFGLDVMAAGGIGRFIELIKKRVPSFLQVKVIECGLPTAIGSAISMVDRADNQQILSLLAEELDILASEEKTSLIDIRDAYTAQRKQFDALIESGYRVIPNMANTFFRVHQKTYGEYLDDLVAKRRREILHRQRAFDSMGCTIEKIVDFGSMAEDLSRLWRGTYQHAKEYQREVLNSDYFRYISDFLGDKSFILLCRMHGNPVGFTMLFDSGSKLISTYCGLDYAVNRSTYTYFVLFYRSIEEAIVLGKEWLELGVTNYNPKIEVGAIPEPMFIYTRSTRPLLNLFLAHVLKFMASPPDYNKRRIFNSRFYDRHKISRAVSASLGERRYRVRDVSFDGIGLEGPEFKSRRFKILLIEVPDGLEITLKAKLKNCRKIKEETWQVGFSVKPESTDHLLLWQSFVERYASGAGTHGQDETK